MTPRSIRRAAERKRIKLEKKHSAAIAARHDEAATPTGPGQIAEDIPSVELCFGPEPSESEPNAVSPSQLFANRANAQFSTGPKTPQGKTISSLNAVKTALTGRTVLLPSDDAAAYEHHILAYQAELHPVGQPECDLVQSIADTSWRLNRIPGLETAIFARGSIEFAASFEDHDPARRACMIELQTFLAYEKQLRNLQLQEARLHRRREKDSASLRQLQQARKAKKTEALDAAARRYIVAQKNNTAFDSMSNGFEFSTAEIEQYLGRCSPAWLARVAAEAGQKRHSEPLNATAQAA